MSSYLIDFENVKSAGLVGIDAIKKEDTVHLFWSKRENKISIEMMELIRKSPSEIVMHKAVIGEKDALDHQLCSFLGFMAGAGLETDFIIVSNDKAYNHLIEFWKSFQPDIRIRRVLDIAAVSMLPEAAAPRKYRNDNRNDGGRNQAGRDDNRTGNAGGETGRNDNRGNQAGGESGRNDNRGNQPGGEDRNRVVPVNIKLEENQRGRNRNQRWNNQITRTIRTIRIIRMSVLHRQQIRMQQLQYQHQEQLQGLLHRMPGQLMKPVRFIRQTPLLQTADRELMHRQPEAGRLMRQPQIRQIQLMRPMLVRQI